MSDWRARPLDCNQLLYAAIDALVTRETYLQIVKLHINKVSKAEMEHAIQRLVTVKAEDWGELLVTDDVKKRFDKFFVYSLRVRDEELERMKAVWKACNM